MGKRVDFSGRTVITSDPFVNIDQLGVPLRIAKELTIPEEVTPYNIKYLNELILNGSNNYPGANYILKINYRDNKEYLQKIDLNHCNKPSIKLNIGDIVERHIINDDYVLFNRQPTLHKPSMMAHKIQIINNLKLNTFRMNVSVCKPYNADFDGDEMNIHVPQSIQAINELKRIANVKYQIVGVKNSIPIIGCEQDTLSGAYMLTYFDRKIKGTDVANILSNTTSETKRNIDMNKLYSGQELFSYIIPKGINIIRKKDNNIFEIRDGILISGYLDSSLLSSTKNSIIHFIWNKFGPDKTKKFIDDAQKLILYYLLYYGQTSGFQDTFIDKDMDNQIQQIVSNDILKNKYNITQFENESLSLSLDLIENKLTDDLTVIQSKIGQILMNYLDHKNFFHISVKSGAKGSLTHIAQMLGVIGQVNLEGMRFKKKIAGRTLIYFHKDDDTPEARGFVNNCYLKGLSFSEFYYNIAAGREGGIDTAIKTATSGYITRQLTKGLEDLIIKYDGTNRNANNTIIQMVYGENGINQAIQIEIILNIISMNNKQIENTFSFTNDQIIKISNNKNKQDFINFNINYIHKIKNYRDTLRSIQANALLNFKTLDEKYMLPINIIRIIQDFRKPQNNNLDLSPFDIENAIENFLNDFDNRIVTSILPSDNFFKKDDRMIKFLLEIGLYEYLAPVKCIFEYNLDKNTFNKIMNEIKLDFTKAIIEPGELVGIIAAQTIGEPTTQFSVSSNTKIKFITKNKKTNNITFISTEIGYICDNLINTYPELTFDTNYENSVETNISNLDDEYYIIGVNKYEKTCWNKISHISRHPPNGNMIKVITKSGRSVNTTLSHSHLIRKNQTIEPILGSELKIGMRIPVSKYIENINIIENIIIENQNYKLNYSFGCILFDFLSIDKIPDFLFISPNECKAGFLKTYFNTFGIFTLNIELYNNNEQFLKDIALLLNYFGIFSIIKYNLDILQYNLTILSKHNNLYNIHINSLNYINEINDDIDKIDGLKEIIIKCNNILLINDNNTLEESIDRIIIEKYIKIFEEHENSYKITNELNILIQAINSNIIWDEIIKIEIYTPNQTDYVYDLSVPLNETFMIDNGIIVHNTLNTKHFAGVAGKGSANMGISRIQELLHYSKNIKTPQMIIYFEDSYQKDKNKLNNTISYLNYLSIRELLYTVEIYYDMKTNNKYDSHLINDNVSNPFYINNQKTDIKLLPIVFRIKMNMEKMLDKNITLLDIKTKFISHWYLYFNNAKNLKKNEKDVITKIIRCAILSNSINDNEQIIHIRFSMISFNYDLITDFLKIILDDIKLKGINNIKNIDIDEERIVKYNKDTGDINIEKEIIVRTNGINFELLKNLKGIDFTRTRTNDIDTILRLYGIEAARQILLSEITLAFISGGSSINHSHLSVLIDQMTFSGEIISIDRHGLSKIDLDPLARASFEKTMNHFVNAAIYNEKDYMNSVSSRIIMGRVIPGGTGCFELLLDTKKLENSEYIKDETGGRISFMPLEEEILIKDIIKFNSTSINFFIPNNI